MDKKYNTREDYRKTYIKAMTGIIKQYLRIIIFGLFIKDLIEFYRFYHDRSRIVIIIPVTLAIVLMLVLICFIRYL